MQETSEGVLSALRLGRNSLNNPMLYAMGTFAGHDLENVRNLTRRGRMD